MDYNIQKRVVGMYSCIYACLLGAHNIQIFKQGRQEVARRADKETKPGSPTSIKILYNNSNSSALSIVSAHYCGRWKFKNSFWMNEWMKGWNTISFFSFEDGDDASKHFTKWEGERVKQVALLLLLFFTKHIIIRLKCNTWTWLKLWWSKSSKWKK